MIEAKKYTRRTALTALKRAHARADRLNQGDEGTLEDWRAAVADLADVVGDVLPFLGPRRFKGGTRNNGEPRITLPSGVTRVAQLKAALRALRPLMTREEGQLIIQRAIEGTFKPAR